MFTDKLSKMVTQSEDLLLLDTSLKTIDESALAPTRHTLVETLERKLVKILKKTYWQTKDNAAE